MRDGYRLPTEVLLASLAVAVSWFSSRQIDEATQALDERLGIRQREIDVLASTQAALRQRQRGDPSDVALPLEPLQHMSLATLFPGRRLVLHGSDGLWLLALESVGAESSGR